MKTIQSKLITNAFRAKKSENLPALAIFLKGKDMEKEVEKLRKRLKNGHSASLLPFTNIEQENGESGYHFLNKICAISSNNAAEIEKSEYANYTSIKSEWLVIVSDKYEETLPETENGYYPLSETSIEKRENLYISVTLMGWE